MKRFVFFLVTLAVLGGAYWWQRQLPERDVRGAVAPVPPPPRMPQVVAEDVELKIRSQGNLVWQLTIAQARVPTDGSAAWVTGLKRGVYYRAGKPYLTVTAGQLRYNPNTQNVVVSGGITIRSTDGLSLDTEHLRWDKQTRRIVCPDAVRLQVKDWVVETHKVFLYPEQEKLVCPNAVRVKARNAQLRGDQLVAYLKTEQVDVTGNVEGVVRILRNRRRLVPHREGV